MTYTFKLARRLAVSRNFMMLPALLVIAACSGDTTAPEGPTDSPTSSTDWRPRDLTPVAVQVSPRTVTIETNQLIHFRAHGRTSAGDSVGAVVTWSTSGGTVLPDGRFSAAAIGTYTVVGANRVRGTIQVDTSIVQVVRRPTRLASIEVSPTNVSLAPGVSRTFTALGRLIGGELVPIGVSWSATGGSIDAGGTYVAGNIAGTYRVIAINTAGTLADTVSVTITAPPTPPPPPAPVVTSVSVMPIAATLTPTQTKQFHAYGRTNTGDSVAVAVTFTASGGSITSTGLYTAGSTIGTFRVIATAGLLADTSIISITRPLGSGSPTGIPFGPFGGWSGSTLLPNTDLFNVTLNSVNADNLVTRINAARLNGDKLLLAMTGGSHSNYKSIIDGVYQFDMAKWKAKMDTYNTFTIKSAVAAAVADGTIVGNIVMDEPANITPENSWGPEGTMNKARVDSLADYARSIFPTLPIGVTLDYRVWNDQSFRKLDFTISQYRWAKGDVTAYRDGALALGARDGHQVIFSLNILDGGTRVSGCPIPQTGGPGTYGGNCRMTADQVRQYGSVLGPAGCALVMWRYDSEYMANPENRLAFKDLADNLAARPARSCTRS